MKNKIEKNKLEEIRKRESLVREYMLVAESIEMNKRLYVKKILNELGYDKDKGYNINLDSGKIEEQKEEQKTEKK